MGWDQLIANSVVLSLNSVKIQHYIVLRSTHRKWAKLTVKSEKLTPKSVTEFQHFESEDIFQHFPKC